MTTKKPRKEISPDKPLLFLDLPEPPPNSQHTSQGVSRIRAPKKGPKE